jgi:hypothetical protein
VSAEVASDAGVGAERPKRPGFWARLRRSPARAVLGAGLGVGAGVAYALVIGCRTGQCPLTSSPLNAGAFGALVGAVMGWPDRTGDRR